VGAAGARPAPGRGLPRRHRPRLPRHRRRVGPDPRGAGRGGDATGVARGLAARERPPTLAGGTVVLDLPVERPGADRHPRAARSHARRGRRLGRPVRRARRSELPPGRAAAARPARTEARERHQGPAGEGGWPGPGRPRDTRAGDPEI
jgi:hypothetical protein